MDEIINNSFMFPVLCFPWRQTRPKSLNCSHFRQSIWLLWINDVRWQDVTEQVSSEVPLVHTKSQVRRTCRWFVAFLGLIHNEHCTLLPLNGKQLTVWRQWHIFHAQQPSPYCSLKLEYIQMKSTHMLTV